MATAQFALCTEGGRSLCRCPEIRLAIEDAFDAARAQAIEECAEEIEHTSMDVLLLAAGEMNAQERRTVKAIQGYFARRLRDRRLSAAPKAKP